MTGFRKQNRLVKYDYSSPGYYFITSCTKNRLEHFGVVEKGIMIQNDTGKIAEEIWKRTPLFYRDVSVDEFIIMPNHIHGIIIINPPKQAGGLRYSLSQIVGSYKNTVTKLARQNNKEFAWQPSFYDHVIRKDESLDKIRDYVRNNPLQWELDKNNPENLWM